MAEKSKTVHVVELNANAKHLSETLSTLRKSFGNMQLPADLEKTFSKLESAIGSIVRKTEKGIIPREDFASTEKELNKVKSAFDSLSGSIEGIKKSSDKKLLALLPEDTVAKLNQAKNAYAAYSQTLSTVVAAERALQAAIEKKAIAEEKVASATASERAYKGKVTLAQKELANYAEITEALKEQTEATEELAKAQAELKKAKDEGKSEKTIASKQAKVDKATSRKSAADAAVGGFSKKELSAQEAAMTKVAKATEKFNAAKKASESAAKSLTEAEVAETSAKSNLSKVQAKSQEEASKEANALKALRAALEAVNPKYKDMAIEGETAGEQLEFLKGKVEDLSQEELNKLKKSLSGVSKGFEDFDNGLEGTKDALNQVKEATKQADEAVAQQNAFEDKIKQFLGLSGAAQVLRSALRDAMQTITELDATMTEMAVVTDLSVGDYWDQLPEYSKRASELGVSINSAYKAATLYYQQGLKTNEVNAISAQTLKMAKIAGLDAADATDKMTAALRGFNMELNETSAQKVADVYSQLAAITAADVDEISSAMTKTASIASSAGMEFETTAAFLSQIIETTRESAETAGTAMKTVIARFQELKKAPSEIGEIDGEIVDANAIETALRSVGVSLRDASGQFRDLDEVFLELSSKWGTLDTNTQRYIATIAAGSRQQSRFIAMMSDYGRTQELVTEANNSAGASNRQFEKTMESLEAKVEKLKNAWHEFTMGIMDSDIVKFGVDVLTKFLEIINKVTQGINGFGGGLTKIMSVLTIFKLGMKIFDKFKPMLKSFLDAVVKDAGTAGEESGKAFAEGVVRGKNGEQVASGDQAQEQAPQNEPGKLGTSSKTGFLGKASNMGLGIMNAVGVGHFKDAWDAHGEIKAAKGVVGSNKEEVVQKRQQYEENKKKLEEKKSEYTFNENGSVSKKGKKGFLSKEEADKAKQEVQDLTDSVEEYEDASASLEKNSKKQWSSISNGISSASTALMGIGVGFGMVGSAFESAGLDGAAEVFNTMSQYASTAGAILGIIPPILSIIQTLFPGVGASSAAAGTTATAAGTAASSAWSIVGIIVIAVIAAIVVALAVVLLIMAAVNNASPEKKLEDTKKAADQAAEAADEAADAYEKLASALDSLDGKYKALENLTKGTKEWNDAVQDINSSVLDLIEQYPELSKFVSNEGGVLTIDTESQEVQAVLQQAEARKTIAKNTSIMSNVAVAQAQNDVDHYNLDETFFDDDDERGATDKLAKSLASGNITNQKDAEDEIRRIAKEEGLDYDNEEIKEMAEELQNNSEELRKYGESLQSTDRQQQAAFDAIAASAQGLANTLDMTAEQIQQSAVAVDGDISGEYYNEMYDKIKDEDFTGKDLNDYDGEHKTLLENAIKQQYGETAKLGEDGNVSYEKDGETVTVELDNDQIKRMIATQYATEQTATAIEYSDEAIAKVAETAGTDAVHAMYMANEGQALTQAQLTELQGVTDYQKIWDSLDENMKKVYGNNMQNMIDDFTEAKNAAAESFAAAGEAARDFMTADMAKGFKNKLDEVASMAGGTVASQAVQAATDTLLAGKNDDEKRSIQERINATDWTSTESLLALQIDLEQQYGYTTEQAKAYVGSLGDAAFATSNLETTVRTFGELWKATEKINQSMERLTALQWKYNKALESGGAGVGELVEDMMSEYQLQAQNYKAAYNASNDDLAKIYAQGGTEYGVDLRDFVTLGSNGVNVDQSRLQEAIDSGKISEEDASEWLEKLNDQYATSQDQLQGLRDTLDSIEELEQQGEDAFYELRDMAKDTILSALQQQIDLQQQAIDATRNANATLVGKIQEQIDDARQARQNEEAKKNIADMQSRAAYLSMDTSGANSLALTGLNDQIADAEQNYQDSLVDQALQQLNDANEKAAEQREQQISLAQMQLDAYGVSAQFQADTDQKLAEMLDAESEWQNTEFGQQMYERFTEGMDSYEAEQWANKIGGSVELANTWKATDWVSYKEQIQGDIDAIESGLSGLPDKIAEASANYKLKAQKTKLERSGFKMEELDKLEEEQLNKLTAFADKEGSNEAIASSTSKLDAAGLSYQSRSDYYQANMQDILDGKEVASYESYLGGQLSSGKSSIASTLAAKLNNKRNGVDTSSDDYKTALEQYQALGGNEAGLQQAVSNLITGGSVDGVSIDGLNSNGGFAGAWDHITATLDSTDYELQVSHKKDGSGKASDTVATALNNIVGTPSDGWIAMYNSLPYIYVGGNRNGWWPISQGNREDDDEGQAFTKAYLEKLRAFESGGLADFTGPAWLDGTKSRPEYVLNADQTERFFSLVDILEKYDTEDGSRNSGGNNYFEIEINVEKLESDYDVEKVADKIRKMIYEDATYRNVNAINHIR